MNKKIVFGLVLVFLCISNTLFAQFNVIKVHSVNNVNPQIVNPLGSLYNSTGVSYERCINDHMSIELMGLYARALLFNDATEKTGTAKTLGYSAELKLKYYFQTNSEELTYAPYGWYVAPILNYTDVKGTFNIVEKDINGKPFVKDVTEHGLSYFALGALCGYQFIMEEFEKGFVIDLGVGFNYLKSKGYGNGSEDVHKIYSFVPKIQFGLGFAF